MITTRITPLLTTALLVAMMASAVAQETGRLEHERTIDAGKSPIRTLDVDRAGRFILAGTMDAKVRLWRMSDGRDLGARVGDSGGFT